MSNESEILELSEYKQRLEMTLAGTNCGTFHHDFSKNLVYYDERAQSLLGITEASLSLDEGLSIIHPDDRSVISDILRGFKNMNPRININYRVLKNGEIRHIKVDSFVEYKGGKPHYSYGLVQDITEIKEKEEELIKANEGLKIITNKLQAALSEIKTLKGIIPICSYCHKIRDDEGAWNQLEAYLRKHSEAEFSHGICPSCLEKEIKNIKNP